MLPYKEQVSCSIIQEMLTVLHFHVFDDQRWRFIDKEEIGGRGGEWEEKG